MRIYLTFGFLFVTCVTFAQFSDDFTDGEFTSAPSWTGSGSNFEVDASNQLHLLAPAESDTSYLSVFSTLVDDVVWDFWLKMEFNPSSGNNTRVYLMSDQENLKGSLNGYFVMIGNSDDEISLYRQSGTSITKIIDGVDDAVDLGSPEVRIQVNRDALGNWEVLRDTIGGFAFVSEGTVFDDTYTSSSYFGVFCKYTSSRSELFYFDDLGSPYVDAIPPVINEVTVVSANELNVVFSEPVDVATGTTLSNYSVDNGIGNPSTAVVDMINSAQVNLTFATDFTNGEMYEINIENVTDLDGNIIVTPAVANFLYFVPVPAEENDVIITEVFADPNPIIGLPEVEFFEIYNRSDKTFDLAGWTINDNSTTADFGSYILAPSAYVIVCGISEGVLFGVPNFIEIGGLPTLTNSDDDLVIKDAAGLQIDSIHYFQEWYNDTDKDDGGWTLERKHLNSPCSDNSNWGASINPIGGTPGEENSIWTDEDDVISPTIADYSIVSNTEVALMFSESLDTNIALTLSISPSVDMLTGGFTAINQYKVDVTTLQPSTVYELTVSEGEDCWGNVMNQTISFGLPGVIEQGDIILNEVLFNPQSGGSDYVEIYNLSDKIIDINELRLANWDDDTISNFEQVGTAQRLLLPNEYALLTEDSTDIINDFAIYGIGTFVDTDLPTYPNDSGTVYLFGADSSLIDYFHYDDDFHYALLNTEDGKALERITFGGGLNNPDNWHTASENVDWGTPGYLNSQFAIPDVMGTVSLDPELFSPDNDGYNDVLTINFDLTETDNVVDVSIYDNQGRLIRLLKDNYFLGQNGILTWDGINDEGTKAAIGTYIVLVSVKNANGDQTQYKLVTVLGGQL